MANGSTVSNPLTSLILPMSRLQGPSLAGALTQATLGFTDLTFRAVKRGKYNATAVSDEVRAVVAEWNALDAVVYDRGLALFRALAAQHAVVV